jgi:hypothetical protein
MPRRREQRIAISVPVIVHGKDAYGRPFEEMAQTVDISRSGACVVGVVSPPAPGIDLQIEYKGEKAAYRVEWIGEKGTPLAGQIGLRAIDPARQIWNDRLPDFASVSSALESRADGSDAAANSGSGDPFLRPTAGHAWAGSERRRFSRQSCRIPAQVTTVEGGVQLKGTITDISRNGCFMEMLAPLPAGSEVVLTANSAGRLFCCRGLVRTSMTAMGMGIEFTTMSPRDRKVLDEELAPLSEPIETFETPFTEFEPTAPTAYAGGEHPAVPLGAGSQSGHSGNGSAAMAEALGEIFNAVVRVLMRKGVITPAELQEEMKNAKSMKK